MTNSEMSKFYRQGFQNYDLDNYCDIDRYLEALEETGYDSYLSIRDLESLIDSIVIWYEIKYPEREFDFYAGRKQANFQSLRELSSLMNINQLFYRLTDKQLALISSNYRTSEDTRKLIFDGAVNNEDIIIKVNRRPEDNYYGKFNDFLIMAKASSGLVNVDYETERYIGNKKITLDDVLKIFKESYSDSLEFDDLESCVSNHAFDVFLRNEVFRIAALKLLYSRKTTPERGYERAKRFIGEFNKKLGLSLSSKEIDEIMKADYSSGKRYVKNIAKM